MTRDTTGDGLVGTAAQPGADAQERPEKKKKKKSALILATKKNVVAITSQDFHLHFTADLN